MMAQYDGDIVTSLASGQSPGLVVPDTYSEYPISRLRVLNGAVVDAAAFETFYVDDNGTKHIVQSDPAWQAVACSWDDQLVKDTATELWRLRTEADEPMTKLQFRKRFTFAEQVAIKTLAQTDVEVAVIEDNFAAASEIVLSDPATIEMVGLLTAKGLLTAERQAEILGTTA